MMPRRRIAAIAVTIIAVFCLIAIVTLKHIKIDLHEAWGPKTDIQRYSELLTRVRDTGFGSHLPDSAGSSALGFYFNPGALQASLTIQLLVQADAAAVAEAISNANTRIRDAQADGRSIDTSHRPMNFLDCLKTEFEDFSQYIPANFELFIHYSESKDNWNHGIQEGIAVDRSTNRILYFSELW